jgi:hypothetical protein
MGKSDDKWHVIIDGVEGPAYDTGFELPVFSPDSSRLGYFVRRGDKSFAIVNGVEGPPFDGVASLSFSPDSKHFAYSVQNGTTERVVEDGVPLPEHDGVSPAVFSPDSKHLGYSAKDSKGNFLVVDGKSTAERFEGYAHNGRPVWDSARTLHTIVYRGKQLFLVDVELTGE